MNPAASAIQFRQGKATGTSYATQLFQGGPTCRPACGTAPPQCSWRSEGWARQAAQSARRGRGTCWPCRRSTIAIDVTDSSVFVLKHTKTGLHARQGRDGGVSSGYDCEDSKIPWVS